MARDILQLNIEKYGKKYASASIMGSRGCFGDCSYCWIAEAQEKHPGLRYRLRSIESIVGGSNIRLINMGSLIFPLKTTTFYHQVKQV